MKNLALFLSIILSMTLTSCAKDPELKTRGSFQSTQDLPLGEESTLQIKGRFESCLGIKKVEFHFRKFKLFIHETRYAKYPCVDAESERVDEYGLDEVIETQDASGAWNVRFLIRGMNRLNRYYRFLNENETRSANQNGFCGSSTWALDQYQSVSQNSCFGVVQPDATEVYEGAYQNNILSLTRFFSNGTKLEYPELERSKK